MIFPHVSGADLQRRQRTFPRDFAGDANIVFIAFQQWQQQQVDSWLPFTEELAAQHPHLAYYEFPTIQPLNWLARTFINEGMRGGIRDEATRARTITLYLDKRAFRRALDLGDENEIWVLLVDGAGEVLWRTRGSYKPEAGAALESALAEVVGAPAPV